MSISPTITFNLPNPFLIGDDWLFNFVYSNNKGVAQSISGFTNRLYITKSGTDISGSPFTGTSTSPTTGVINFKVESATTATLTAGSYQYEVEVTDTNNINITYLRGSFVVEAKY